MSTPNRKIEYPFSCAPNDEKIGRIGEMQKRKAILDLAELLVFWQDEEVLDLEQCYKWLTELRQLLNFIGSHSVVQERCLLVQNGQKHSLKDILESLTGDLRMGFALARSKGWHTVELTEEGKNLMQTVARELRERLWRLS